MNSNDSSQSFLAQLRSALDSVQVDRPASLDVRGCGLGRRRVLLVGNGGSAAVAAHIANDLVKLGIAAMSLSEPAVLTCLANDNGYADVYARQVYAHANPGDKLVAISSSGRSPNILNAVAAARDCYAQVITLSGFDPDNPLRKLGDHNYYVSSHNYGVVECAHLAILHSIAKPT